MKPIMNRLTLLPSLLLLSLLCLVTGCASHGTKSPFPEPEVPPTKILVLPTEILAKKTQLNEAQYEKLQEGALYMDSVMRADLADARNVSFIKNGDSVRGLSSMTGGMWNEIKRLTQENNADAILLVGLERYRQREGSSASVISPASAQFALRLLDGQEGRLLWSASFDETQEALMENLFSFGKALDRGFKWITVEEMVAAGLQERLAECPYINKAS